jgi:predicted N-acetyltransferase YhbS
LAADHDLSAFDCGEASVNHWLQRRARKNEQSGASRVYVVCNDRTVIAFYTLSASAVVHDRVRGRFRRGMPDPVPVMLLGQLGVDTRYQRRGMAASLVRDALLRCVSVSSQAGVAAVLVDALTEDLVPFYRRLGFDAISETEPTTMMIRMKDVRAVLSELVR